MDSRRAGLVRIVAFGGGRGLSTLLRGLTWLGSRVETTAIVAVTDDGGSTGRLRADLGLPAVGDLRRCLSAVAGQEEWAQLLEHRFLDAPSLEGHPLGNLVLAAAHQRTGSLSQSLSLLCRISGAKARVLPMTDAAATLSTRMADGRVFHGQAVLAQVTGPVEWVWLTPDGAMPAPGVLEAISAADLIVLGPGSLFTSVLASTLAAGVRRAITRSRALKVLVQNLTCQRGETEGMDIAAHVRAVQRHLGWGGLDFVLCHRWPSLAHQDGLSSDSNALARLGVREVQANLATDGGLGRVHDSRRLALALLRLAVIQGRTAKLRA